jgi:hypothetical protein
VSIGRVRLSQVLASLIADTPAEREEGAEVVCDLHHSLDSLELKIIVRVLSALAAVEDSPTAREAQLHAVTEILDVDVTKRDDVAPILQIDPNTLVGSEIEYFTELSNAYGLDRLSRMSSA